MIYYQKMITMRYWFPYVIFTMDLNDQNKISPNDNKLSLLTVNYSLHDCKLQFTECEQQLQ